MSGSCGSSGNFSPCTGTLNGDGNGYIQGPEMLLVWNQLALAGIISGKYTGMGVNGNYMVLDSWSAVEANLPTTALSHVYPMIWYEGQPSGGGAYDGNGFYTSGYAGHVMVFGTPLALDLSASGPNTVLPSMYSADAFSIDNKLDDGNPTTGSVQTMAAGGGDYPYYNVNQTFCVKYSNIADLSTYSYNLSFTGQGACAVVFVNVF